MTKKKILMVVGSYYPEISGAGLQCYNIVSSLKNKIDFLIFTTVIDYKKKHNKFNNENNIYRVYLNPNNPFSKFLSLFKFFYFFYKHKLLFDIIHIHGISYKSLAFIIFGKITNKKIILKLTNLYEDDLITIKRKSFIIFNILKLVDKIIVLTPEFFNNSKLSGYNLNKIILLPNFVDTNKFINSNKIKKNINKKKIGLTSNLHTVIFVGFYSKRKKPDFVYKIWKQSFLQGHKSNLILIGSYKSNYFENDNTIYSKIYNDAKINNLLKYIKFINSTDNIDFYYQSSDIFILPSSNEGLPNALLESMSSGLCPIITNIKGVSDWIIEDNFNGYIIDVNNENEAIKLLNNIIENKIDITSISLEARKTIIKNFEKNKIIDKIYALYQSL